jgi:hypothetical protein
MRSSTACWKERSSREHATDSSRVTFDPVGSLLKMSWQASRCRRCLFPRWMATPAVPPIFTPCGAGEATRPSRRGDRIKGRENHSGFMMLPASNRVGRNARPLARSLRPTRRNTRGCSSVLSRKVDPGQDGRWGSCLCGKYTRSMNGAFNTEDRQGLRLRGR